MGSDVPKSVNMNVNIDQMRELIIIATRRVSAFIRFGLDGLEDRDFADFNLTASVSYQFWPAEIAPEARHAAREEYRAWLIGSCIRELDLFFGIFLDRIWLSIEVAELHGTLVSVDHVFDTKFSRNTNVSVKYRKISEKLMIDDQFEELNSLSLARNSLAHHAGIVRSPDDCNNEERNALVIKWRAFEMVASRDGNEIVVDQAPFDTDRLPGDSPMAISLRLSRREVRFEASSQIKLSNSQLAELCMFYQILCNKAIDGYLSLIKERGIIS